MKQSVGESVSINIIVIFIVIMFAFILGILSYTKAFKVNSRIGKALEECEGYNVCSKKEIERVLTTLGYIREGVNCSAINDKTLVNDGSEGICIYEVTNDVKHYGYHIVTYIRMDLPIIGKSIKLSVKSKSNGIYKFSSAY